MGFMIVDQDPSKVVWSETIPDSITKSSVKAGHFLTVDANGDLSATPDITNGAGTPEEATNHVFMVMRDLDEPDIKSSSDAPLAIGKFMASFDSYDTDKTYNEHDELTVKNGQATPASAGDGVVGWVVDAPATDDDPLIASMDI